VENMIMMVNNAGDVFNFALAQKENTTCKDQSEIPCKSICALYFMIMMF